MNLHNRLLTCALATVVVTAALAHSGTAPSSMTADKTGFEENKGQVRATDGTAAPFVRYRLSQGNTQLFLLENGIAYQFSRMHHPQGYAELVADAHHDMKKQEQLDALREQVHLETFRMNMLLEGASTNVRITTEGRSSDYTQYYNHDALDVHSYTKVTYHDIYPGIDWVVYTTEARHPGASSGVKYDFVVRPGADPKMIRLRFDHHEELALDAKGDLTLGNRMGRITEQHPVSFQDGAEVTTKFVLEDDLLRFDLNGYDRSKILTIDPELIWATYYGGSGSEEGLSCAVDGSGNVFLAGWTASTASIASGGHQNASSGAWDAYLVKFNEAGVRQWGTYYGGTGDDIGLDCAIDGTGNVYLVGRTNSSSGISSNGHQAALSGGNDAFLVKFDASGSRIWSTYYGGTAGDEGRSCTVDGTGNVYLAGETSSGSGIASGGHQTTYGGGTTDAFLAKVNSVGVRIWSTYYGGSADDVDPDCALDGNGNVYLAGGTNSTNAISSGGHQNSIGGMWDAFLVKFNSNGTRIWGTYYGGSQVDGYGSCCTDPSGNVFLAGTTDSPSAIASGGHQNTYGGMDGGASPFSPSGDAFLVKFSEGGVRQWATYYGGQNDDLLGGCTADGAGNVYVRGQTNGSAGLALNGHQMTYAGGGDYYFAQFSGTGSLLWGTYYGGSGFDFISGGLGNGIATGANGVVYFAGTTSSSSGIAFNGHQNTNSDQSAFLTRFGLDTPEDLTTGSIAGSPFCEGAALMVPFTASDVFIEGNIFTAQLSDGAGSFAAPVDIGTLSGTSSGAINAIIPLGTPMSSGYRIRVIGSDPATEGSENANDLTVSNVMTWYPDEDGDGYGSELGEVATCTPPQGYVLNNSDDCPTVSGLIGSPCDDDDATTENDVITEECECEGISVLPMITAYRYWFDDDIANAVTTTVDPVEELLIEEAFLADDLDGGLRRVSVQAQDNMGYWSSPQTTLFARVGGVISSYRYWVNDDPSNMQTVAVTPVEVLDLTSPLAIGNADRPFNMLTIQFLDGAGVISVPYTTTFVRSTGPIVEYEYWIDDAIIDRVAIGTGPAQVVDLIDDLPITATVGPHVFTIRFRGESGAWSVPLSTAFMMEAIAYDCPDLEANIGDECDPGPGFENGEVTEACECVGTPIAMMDCNGVLGGPAQPGTPCDDLDACTVNDVYTGAFPNCGCTGTPGPDSDNDGICDVQDDCLLAVDGITNFDENTCACLLGYYGTVTDIGGNDVITACTICPAGYFCADGISATPCPAGRFQDQEGQIACIDCAAGTFNGAIAQTSCTACPAGTASNVTGAQACPPCAANTYNPNEGQTECLACPNGESSGIGATECTPVQACTDYILELQSGSTAPNAVTYDVLDATGTTTVFSGNNPVPANSIGTLTLCLTDACYRLRVTDSAGDGLTGYILRETGVSGRRIIDNAGNMSNGVSQIANGGTFCLPLGDDRPIFSSCDKVDWVTNKFIVATENVAVSAQYNVTNTTSGYEFWFYDPNGTYSFRRFRNHATSDGFGTGALRANHFRINAWVNTPSTPHLPANVLMNVRIRGRVAGVNQAFGPACLFKIDAALAMCPRVKLQDNPLSSDFSCGVNKQFGGANTAANRITATPPQPIPAVSSANVRYQFRFRIPGETICIVRPPQTSATFYLNWSAASGPQLQCGRQYEVDVRVSLDGGTTWCFGGAVPSCLEPVTPWGKVCMVNITTSTFCPSTLQGSNIAMATEDGNLTLYPNPNRGDQVFISLSEVSADVNTVSVDIFDMTGKRVSARTIAAQDGFVKTNIDLNGELSGGLYMVNIIAGDKTYTERLVIQP